MVLVPVLSKGLVSLNSQVENFQRASLKQLLRFGQNCSQVSFLHVLGTICF